ncbi:MAG: DUF6612 family protein [Bacillus sp. (in: firmicutes)]
MKKGLLLLTPILAATIVSGCSSDKQKLTAVTPSIVSVIAEVENAYTDVSSYTKEMDINIEIVDEDEGTMELDETADIEFKSDVTFEPFAVYQERKVESTGITPYEMEVYVTPELSYTIDEDDVVTSYVLDGDDMEEIMKQVAADSQLAQLDMLSDYLKIKEDGDHYILSADIPAEEARQMAMTVLYDVPMFDQDRIPNMNYDSLTVEFQVNRDTYYLEGVNVVVKGDEEKLGLTEHLTIEVNSEFSNMNEVDEIVVPDKVVNRGE